MIIVINIIILCVVGGVLFSLLDGTDDRRTTNQHKTLNKLKNNN